MHDISVLRLFVFGTCHTICLVVLQKEEMLTADQLDKSGSEQLAGNFADLCDEVRGECGDVSCPTLFSCAVCITTTCLVRPV